MHTLEPMLTADQESALHAIFEAPQAWCPSRDLERAGHCDDTLIDLCVSGWIEPWTHDRHGKPLNYASWCLTPWAARQLGRWVVQVRGQPMWSTDENVHQGRSIARPDGRRRRLIFPEPVTDRIGTNGRRAQYIMSRYWNETTLDPDRAERILGAPVELVETL